MIIAKNISKKFHDDHFALLNISFSTEERPLVVVGDDGAGKTTLLDIIAGLDNLYDGELMVNGKERKSISNEEISISYITDKPVFFNFKTVYKNLEYVFKVKNKKINKKEVQDKIAKVALELNIIEFLNKRVYKLNNFEKRLVCVARILLKKPQIILVDEPFFKLTKFEISSLWQLLVSVSNKLSSDMIVAEKVQNIGYFGGCNILKLNFGTVENLKM